MKKFLLSIAFLASGFGAFAQTVPLTQDWMLKIGVSSLITSHSATGNPSVAYNPSTDHVYLSDWNNKISILNTDGTLASPSTLTLGSGWTESGKFIKVRVAEDGAIYAINRITSAGDLYVYRWTSETDNAPTKTKLTLTQRSGDSFAVVGSGDNTLLFMSANVSTKIFVAKVLSGVPSLAYEISVPENTARGSISAETSSSIWINTPNSGAGYETKRVNFNNSDGSVTSTDVIPGAKIDWALANTEFFADGARKYLAVSGAVIGGSPAASNIGLKLRIYDITADIANPILKSEGEMFPYVAATNPIASSNINGFGDVAIKKNANGTHTFFHVVFGSGLASYTTQWTLPVSLTSFNVSLIKGESTLTWETASETNNKGFEVLRSSDGQTFSKIDFVSSKGQNGNSSTTLSYSYVDRTAKSGINYYQLNQVDLDGTSELFKEVKSVNVTLNSDAVVVFPNPATTHVSVNTGSEDYKGFKYEFFDASGKKVLSEKAKAAQQDISLSKLQSAIYYLKVYKNGTEQKTVKIIKQ